MDPLLDDFWGRICGGLRKTLPPNFIPWEHDVNFTPDMRVYWVSQSLENVPLPRVDMGPVLFDMLSTQLICVLSHLREEAQVGSKDVLLVGVQKKGMSLLQELDRKLELRVRGKYQIISNYDLEQRPLERLQRKTLIVVDDTIHTGGSLEKLLDKLDETVSVTVLTTLAWTKGMQKVKYRTLPDGSLLKRNVQIYCLMLVPEEAYFSYLFARYVIPLLDHCSRGAIANRPRLPLLVHHPKLSPEEQASLLLKALCELPLTDVLERMPPPAPEHPSPIFHGTLYYSDSFAGEMAARFPGFKLEQEKVRVFIAPGPRFSLHLCPIRFVQVPVHAALGANPSRAQLDSAIAEMSVQTLDMAQYVIGRLRKELMPKLGSLGFETWEETP